MHQEYEKITELFLKMIWRKVFFSKDKKIDRKMVKFLIVLKIRRIN